MHEVKGKRFFFEKKKQKTFVLVPWALKTWEQKVFCGAFLPEKRPLIF